MSTTAKKFHTNSVVSGVAQQKARLSLFSMSSLYDYRDADTAVVMFENVCLFLSQASQPSTPYLSTNKVYSPVEVGSNTAGMLVRWHSKVSRSWPSFYVLGIGVKDPLRCPKGNNELSVRPRRTAVLVVDLLRYIAAFALSSARRRRQHQRSTSSSRG